MSENGKSGVGRREIILGGGLAAAAVAMRSLAAPGAASPATPAWNQETDIIVVGSGAAASSAAVTAVSNGAQVIMLEKLPLLGGTTGKSGGVAWIPNNPVLKANGVNDRKEDALRYMARFAYPQQYTPNSATLGATAAQYRLLEAFYDHGASAIEQLQKVKAATFKEFRLFMVNRPAPDYADHLPEDKTPTGRSIDPVVGSGGSGGGHSLVSQIESWLRARNVPILTETAVTRVIKDNGRVIGVEATDADGKPIRIKARRAVIFGTGGYVHNVDLVSTHQIALYGSCAMPGATGDLIPIAAEAGAAMGNLGSAWRSQVVVEDALDNRVLGRCADVLPGDSMIVVNKYGRRVVNEKRDYNDRSRVHLIYDPTREEYPNQLLFMIFDARSLDAFGGSYPFPLNKPEARHLIEASSLPELAGRIAARLDAIADRVGGVKLAPEFRANMLGERTRFDRYAKAGRDPDFDRGLHAYDREWHLLFSARREGTTYPVNPHPNITMHPFSAKGPYYAFILAAGALDTNGGPRINEKAQILGFDHTPIPGLYGAGNCIASPSRDAYFGAGCTIGLALTFGHIAALNAVREQSA